MIVYLHQCTKLISFFILLALSDLLSCFPSCFLLSLSVFHLSSVHLNICSTGHPLSTPFAVPSMVFRPSQGLPFHQSVLVRVWPPVLLPSSPTHRFLSYLPPSLPLTFFSSSYHLQCFPSSILPVLSYLIRISIHFFLLSLYLIAFF